MNIQSIRSSWLAPRPAPPRKPTRSGPPRCTCSSSAGTIALEHPAAYQFLEHHHHASYLDDANKKLDSSLKQLGAMFVARAQVAGVVKNAVAADR